MSKGFLRRHAIGSYFVVAFVVSWLGTILANRAGLFVRGEAVEPSGLWLVGLAMISGPAVGGVAMTCLFDGLDGLRALLGRQKKWRVSGSWYAAVLIFPVLILGTLLPLSAAVSTELTPNFFAPGIVMGLVAGFIEEIGWTGFALPRMHSRHGFLGASLILGFVHALWHLPADYLGNSKAFGDEWLPYFSGFFLFVMALRLLIAWVYANTESLLLAQLMHASSTGFLGVLLPIGIEGAYWAAFYTVYAVVLWGAAVIVVARCGGRLIRRP